MQTRTDTQADLRFPSPPVEPSDRLTPITTWYEMFVETGLTGVQFDAFWYESVESGFAYFFRWLGEPRATVLVVWDEEGPLHIECRTFRGQLVSAQDADPILAEMTILFRDAGYLRDLVTH